MKINQIIVRETIVYFDQPKTIFLCTLLNTDILSYNTNTKYTQLCKNINCEIIQDINEVLFEAAINNFLDVCKWVCSIYGTNFNVIHMFKEASQCGCLEILKWLYTTFDVMKSNNIIYDVYNAFYEAAAGGHLEILVWLYETFDLTKEGVLSFRNYDVERAFQVASKKGRLEVLKWLYTTFNVINNIKYDVHNAFYVAAARGYLEILVWLYETFNLTKEDALSRDNYYGSQGAFQVASEKGRLEVLKWLHSTFKLTKEDAIMAGNQAFRWATREGHLVVCKWLYETFDLKEDIKDSNFLTLPAETQKYDVLKWLIEIYEN